MLQMLDAQKLGFSKRREDTFADVYRDVSFVDWCKTDCGAF